LQALSPSEKWRYSGSLWSDVGKLRLFPAAARITEALLELVHTAGRIDKTLFPSEEWVTLRADTYVKITHRGARLENVSARALDRRFFIFRMEFRFHDRRKNWKGRTLVAINKSIKRKFKRHEPLLTFTRCYLQESQVGLENETARSRPIFSNQLPVTSTDKIPMIATMRYTERDTGWWNP